MRIKPDLFACKEITGIVKGAFRSEQWSYYSFYRNTPLLTGPPPRFIRYWRRFSFALLTLPRL